MKKLILLIGVLFLANQAFAVPFTSPSSIAEHKDSVDYFYPRSTNDGRYIVVVTKDRNVFYVECKNGNCLRPYTELEDLFGKKGY